MTDVAKQPVGEAEGVAMSPVDLRPLPPPNRQPLWLFWTRSYVGLAFIRAGSAILGGSNWVYQRTRHRSSWARDVSMKVFRLGMWISPKARHVPMKRQQR
jgi:hypothetical protein